MNKARFITLALSVCILSTSCLGSFSAFNGLRDWNSQVSNNKFVNNLVFWGLNIIPVYPLFLAGDMIIFNVIEFWSGSNPLAMKEGEVETQTLVKNGTTYEMKATKNHMQIKVLDGKDAGNSVDLFYKPEEQSWNAKTQDGKVIKLSSMEDGFYYVYLPDGEKVQMDQSTSKEEGMAIINSRIEGCETSFYALAQ